MLRLTCESCGATLSVPEGDEHFACVYCGTEYMAEQRGDVVSFRVIAEQLEDIKELATEETAYTSKVASELALERLAKELAKKQSLQATLGRGLTGAIVMVVLLVVLPSRLWEWLLGGQGGQAFLIITGILVVIGLVVAILSSGSKIQKIESKIRQHRQIVDGEDSSR